MGFFDRIRQAREAEQLKQDLDRNNQNKLRELEPQLRHNVQEWTKIAVQRATARVQTKGSTKLQFLFKQIDANEQLMESESLRICEEAILSGFEHGFYERGFQLEQISVLYNEITYLFQQIGITDNDIVEEYKAAMYELYQLGYGFGDENHLQNFFVMKRY
ncbi:hypothetical protein CN425_02635 [Bacillus cereus]|uniref:Uncharacterized protein n=1 Tax=Bacillus cereus TaxID=1396 RepID=A0A2A8Q1Q3_BACCE|nr:hypothetical protein [Bacillus cereus]EJS68016.1 hypothetical protein ICY_04783 [Bacillus cereus BAG2X1-3]PEA06877.1 hypothetical protein CON38_25725 [Bacillus cereus]PEW06071.1 hypothetical protein CN425_02635 [Bacillus cereus]